MEQNLSSQRPLALITGASSGIGFELARTFADHGFDLFVVAEDLGLTEAADTFRQLGAVVEELRVDLATEEGVQKISARIKDRAGKLDTVCLNAGVGVGGEFMQTNIEEEVKMINLNIVSLVRLTKEVLPIFADKGHGRILFTSSVAADAPGPFLSVYSATKAFVQSFAQAIRQEVKDRGIVVTSLQPGATDTEFFERAHMMDTKVGQGKKDDPAEVAEMGFDALMDGKDHVVAGSFMNKIQTAFTKLIPETQAAKMEAKQAKPRPNSH